MWPAASRPTMALPAQHIAVMLSSKYGWLAIQFWECAGAAGSEDIR